MRITGNCARIGTAVDSSRQMDSASSARATTTTRRRLAGISLSYCRGFCKSEIGGDCCDDGVTSIESSDSFNVGKSQIRANQGHSIKVDVELEKTTPPDILYHGTATRFLDQIFKEGLKSKGRLYVHLSKDVDTATKVGRRHGKPIVLKVDSKKMVEDGFEFYLSANGIWLVNCVPVGYFEKI